MELVRVRDEGLSELSLMREETCRLYFSLFFFTVGQERVNRASWHVTSLSHFITVGVCGERERVF